MLLSVYLTRSKGLYIHLYKCRFFCVCVWEDIGHLYNPQVHTLINAINWQSSFHIFVTRSRFLIFNTLYVFLKKPIIFGLRKCRPLLLLSLSFWKMDQRLPWQKTITFPVVGELVTNNRRMMNLEDKCVLLARSTIIRKVVETFWKILGKGHG